jgi:toxin ParE1/3/4
VKPVLFHEQAKAELADAAAWYERQRPGLGSEFRSAVDDAVARIRENPQSGPFYLAETIRYYLVRRFPYVVFYSESENALRVLAVAHGRRKPGYWRDRDR